VFARIYFWFTKRNSLEFLSFVINMNYEPNHKKAAEAAYFLSFFVVVLYL